MRHTARCLALAACIGWHAYAFDEPQGLRDRLLHRMQAELDQLPDFVCSQSVERFRRDSAEKPWQRIDLLKFDIALVAGQELYALPGERTFRNRPLSEFASRGSISTGQFALLARHVFIGSAAELKYEGESERDGRPAYEYSYDVPAKKSSYRLRFGNSESIVAFQGRFWIDAKTEDLIRLEVQAYDIPDSLALAQTDTSLTYSRVNIDGTDLLLPLRATLEVATVDGMQNLNRAEMSSCRHYRTESSIRFAGDQTPGESGSRPAASPPDADPTAPAATPQQFAIPKGALLEVTLDSTLDPGSAQIGDAVKARLVRAVKDGAKLPIPTGANITGRLVRLEKKNMPFPIHEIGIELDSIEIDGHAMALAATMVDAGPAPGLLRQSKTMDPTFMPHQKSHIDILVKEVQRGQGILQWDARKGAVPRGFKMNWRLMESSAP